MDGQPDVKRLNLFNYLFGKKEKVEVSEQAILDLIDQGNKKGVINQTSKEMLQGVLEFDEKMASEIMTSRVEVEAIDLSKSPKDMMQIILETEYSRLPVYEENIHHIRGIIHVQDFLCQVHKQGIEGIDIEKLIIPPYIVPETKNVQKLFKELQKTQNHMALLRDEYGDFIGLVTMEDILEEIVGDIRDENELSEEITYMEDGSYLVDGLTHIDQLNKHLKLGIECENFDTIGGFVVNLIGNIPKEMQEISVSHEDIVFEVKKVKANRVDKLRIYYRSNIAV